MKTSELIAALTADPIQEPIRLGRRVAVALAIGFLGSLAIYALLMGPRPDIAEAARTMRFNLKFVDAFAFALPTLLLMLRLARPDAKPRTIALWLLAPLIILAAGVVVELIVVPSNEWMSRLVGHHSMFCMRMIPLLAAPILIALIVALRAGAPLHPGLTGALAGAGSAGVAALLYASHCPDDSPLFVATWYPLATVICVGVGALAGQRFLAW
ncbi:MAG: DUF1109 domain-containing protein [Hyphomicrobiales bacterium]|nr:DUF1109 domain-containing protein [Hyphomicrobiales bacterium]